MSRFKFRMDVEPKDIPALDDRHKRDCADVINRAINKTFKYTLIFSMVTAAFFAVYTLFSLTYMMRMHHQLPEINGIVPLLAIGIFVFEFISGTMQKWALALELLMHVIIAVLSAMMIQTLIILPFAIYGMYLHINLVGMVPHYDVISKLKGYPDFISLPIGDVIKKVPAEESAEEIPDEKQEAPEEIKKVPEENKAEEKIPEEKQEVSEEIKKVPEENKAEEKIPEEKQEIPEEVKEKPSEKQRKKRKKKKPRS